MGMYPNMFSFSVKYLFTFVIFVHVTCLANFLKIFSDLGHALGAQDNN